MTQEYEFCNGGCGSRMILYLFVGLMFFIGCRTQKVVERDTSKDSTHVEYSESIVYVDVPIYIEIPAQSALVETLDSTSHLETDYAWSDAGYKWADGRLILFHELANKPQKIEKQVAVPRKVIRYKYYHKEWRTRYRDRYIEQKLTLYQRLKINFSPWIILALIMYIVYLRLKR